MRGWRPFYIQAPQTELGFIRRRGRNIGWGIHREYMVFAHCGTNPLQFDDNAQFGLRYVLCSGQPLKLR